MFINLIIYGVYGIMIGVYFEYVNPIILLVLFYLIPILINTIFLCVEHKREKLKKVMQYYTCLNSFFMYIFVGIFLEHSGWWTAFVKKYSVYKDDIYVEISNSFISISQVIYIFILYFGVSVLLKKIIIRGKKK